MTYDQFLEHVEKIYSSQLNFCTQRELRLGQVFFNELLTIKPSIAEEIRGSMLDPFFKEHITKVISDFVRERW